MANEHDPRTEFGQLLRRYRTAAGLTQDELAERATLSAHAISDLERGARRVPYRETVRLLADALGLGDHERAELQRARRQAKPISEEWPPTASRLDGLPTGVVTFLFTDVEDSTSLWERHRDAMRAAAARHDVIIESLAAQYSGQMVRPRGEGDSRFVVFPRASDAVAAACALQRAFVHEPWPTPVALRVRVALHTGEADVRAGDYYGSSVNRCARLRSIAHGGQVVLSGVTADLVQGSLPAEAQLRALGQHRLKGLDAPETVWQLAHPDLPSNFPPLNSLETHQHTYLPIQLSSFVGRERDVAELRAMLQRDDVRLVTLCGVGGSGKTRLAIAVGEALGASFPDGVWFVDLSELTDPALVVTAIAQVVGIHPVGSQSVVEALHATLFPKHVLIVLDNFEQLLPAKAVIHDLLIRAPRLKLLVTSRIVLRLSGEHEYTVLPLPAPTGSDLQTIQHSPAVQLFVERACAVQPGFSLTKENASAVGEVCRRVDGLPLALELAAARTKLLAPRHLLARLNQDTRLLTGPGLGVPERQRTLRNTLQWSYELLEQPERVLFRRLGVFAGGFTLDAAEAVCSSGGQLDVLEGIASLLDKNLLQRRENLDAESRYGMLVTIGEFAREQLAEAGETAQLREQHARWAVALAETAMQPLMSGQRRPWLKRLSVEQENLRTAVEWARASGACELGLRIVGSLWCWYRLRAAGEGLRWAEALLPLCRSGAPPAVVAQALLAAGYAAIYQREIPAATRYLEEAVTVWSAIGDDRGLGHALALVGCYHVASGEKARGNAEIEEGLKRLRTADARWELASSLGITSAYRAMSGLAPDHAAAEESLSIAEELDDSWLVAGGLQVVGALAHRAGDFAEGRTVLREALRHFREWEDHHHVRVVLRELGLLCQNTGEHQQALDYHREGLEEALACGSVQGAISQARYCACAYLGLGLVPQGIQLLAAARRRQTSLQPPADVVVEERALEDVRSATDGESYREAWAAGEWLSIDELLALARDEQVLTR